MQSYLTSISFEFGFDILFQKKASSPINLGEETSSISSILYRFA